MKKGRGFTIIELLIVIGIIGILIGISAFSLTILRGRGRDAKRQSDINIIREALQEYYADQGFYPAWGSLVLDYSDSSHPNLDWPVFTNRTGNPHCYRNGVFHDDIVDGGPGCPPLRVYLQRFPHDPQECSSGCPGGHYQHYCYQARSDITEGDANPPGSWPSECDNANTMCNYYTLDTTLEGGGGNFFVCYDRYNSRYDALHNITEVLPESRHDNNYRVTPLGTQRTSL